MKNHFTHLIAFTAILLSAALVTGCAISSASDFESPKGSVSFSINRSVAESMQQAGETQMLIAEISLLGQHEESQEIEVKADAKASFAEIPVGSLIYAKARIYSRSLPEKTLYQGQSESITVSQGENQIKLKLTKIKNDDKNTESSDNTENSGNTENSETPDTPDTPETPNTPETPDTPNTPETPDSPDTPTSPDTESEEKIAAYTVRHYQQNVSGDLYIEVTEDAESKSGIAGSQTAAAAKEYQGFTAKTFQQATIAEDGTSLVNIYYDRNVHTVSYIDGTSTQTLNVRYGAAVTLPAKEGEHKTFNGWLYNETLYTAASNSLIMPDSNITLTADWTLLSDASTSISHATDHPLTLNCSTTTIHKGIATTIEIQVQDQEISQESVNWNLTLWNADIQITNPDFVTTNANSITLTIPYPGNYTIKASASYLGITYDAEFQITCEDD